MLSLKYLRYIARHKWYVFVECRRLGIPWLGLLHDLSKLVPDEFWPYADNFYGPKRLAWHEIVEAHGLYGDAGASLRDFYWKQSKEHLKACFDEAWLAHIHRNKHHWQHWILHLDDGGLVFLPMPERYRREMLADWIGAGRAILGDKADVGAWYKEQRERGRIDMHPETRTWVEDQLLQRAVRERA